MSMSHHRSHRMWCNVVQCGMMWCDVARCGAQMNSYWVFVTAVGARKFLGNFTEISVEKFWDFIFMFFAINCFPGLKLWPDAFLPDQARLRTIHANRRGAAFDIFSQFFWPSMSYQFLSWSRWPKDKTRKRKTKNKLLGRGGFTRFLETDNNKVTVEISRQLSGMFCCTCTTSVVRANKRYNTRLSPI